jgi:N-acetyl-anhydromuramyl-L-alanine amidase AmpD
VSYHCIIAENGKRTVLATANKRTWHAGLANWKGKKDLNSISVGLAFEKDTYSKPLTDDQMYSALEYLKPILKKYSIPFDNILDHRMIASNRKNDLNPVEYHRFKKFLLLHNP